MTALTPEQRQRAWESAFVYSLDLHPDDEIAWEAAWWRELNAPRIADLCDSLLQDRRAHAFSIPAEVTPNDLDTLWQRVPRAEVLGWVRSGGLCLLAAVRMVYWLGQSAEELAT